MEGPPRKPPGASAKGGALLKGTDCVSIFLPRVPAPSVLGSGAERRLDLANRLLVVAVAHRGHA